MTTGEKIRFYRNRLGLSQEELGQKLTANRQTVEFWESDEATPTVKELIRLKKLFGVTVDELLSDGADVPKTAAEPKEFYQFVYPAEELAKMNNTTRKIGLNLQMPQIITLIALLLAGFCIDNVSGGAEFMFGFLLAVGLLFWKNRHMIKKNQHKNLTKIAQSCYQYQVFDNYFTLTIRRNDEVVRTSKFYFEEVEQLFDIGEYFLPFVAGQTFILRKADLAKDSAFYRYITCYPTRIRRANDKWRLLSGVFTAAAFLSFCGGAALALRSGTRFIPAQNMRVFLWFLPVPLASVVYGFVLKARGYPYKTNVIVGIIITILLCVYGCFSFIF